MPNIQIDKGNYTRFSNEILEELLKIKLSGQQLQIILFIFRKTFGFAGKHKGDFISLSQIAEALNIRQERASKVLKSVIKKGIISAKNSGKGVMNFISFNKDFDTWTTVVEDSSFVEKSTVVKDVKYCRKKREVLSLRTYTKERKKLIQKKL